MQNEMDPVTLRHAARNGGRRIARRRLPGRWRELLRLPDGSEWLVRPITRHDASALQEGFRSLSPEAVRFRFQHPMSELSDELAARLAGVGSPQAIALVAVEHGVVEARIGAVARASLTEDGREAEFALTVGEPLANLGLGTLLMKRLLRWARLKRLDAIFGDISHENRAMLRVVEKLGFQRVPIPDGGGAIRARLELRPRE